MIDELFCSPRNSTHLTHTLLAMKILSTFIQPASVVSSVKANLIHDSDLEYLVIAKTSCVEVFAILSDQLHLACTLEIWGRITSLETIKSTVCVLMNHHVPQADDSE
jgi:DNA damage-binding protein 1